MNARDRAKMRERLADLKGFGWMTESERKGIASWAVREVDRAVRAERAKVVNHPSDKFTRQADRAILKAHAKACQGRM